MKDTRQKGYIAVSREMLWATRLKKYVHYLKLCGASERYAKRLAQAMLEKGLVIKYTWQR